MVAGGTPGAGAGAVDGALAGVARSLAGRGGTGVATGSVAPKRRRQKLIIARVPPSVSCLSVSGVIGGSGKMLNLPVAGACWRGARIRAAPTHHLVPAG
jgi:hypothetical protein